MTEREKAIFEAQGYLRNIARVQEDISMVYPDGIYGEETYDSVRSFQNKHSINETGEIDYETWTRLVEENRKVVFEESEPVQVAGIRKEDLPLAEGMDNEFVYTLRLMLRNLASKFSNFTFIDVGSVFDEETKRQVLIFQQVISVPQTGVVDKKTWNELAEVYLLKEETV